MADLTDQQKQALIQQIAQDPRVQGQDLNATQLRALGYDVPNTWTYHTKTSDGKNWRSEPTGVYTDDGFFGGLGRALPYIGGGMLALGGGLAAAGGGAAAAAPTTSAAIPSTAVQAGGVTGGILPGTEAGLAAGAGKTAATSLLSQWLGPAISAGTGLAGALIQKSAANSATQAQADAADKAIALTKEMYDQDRADYAPYRNIGAFSLGELGHLVGMPKDFGTQAVADATAPRTAVPRDGGTVPSAPSLNTGVPSRVPPAQPAMASAPEFQSLRDLGARQQSSSSFVRMRSPDGQDVEDVHPSEVDMFERAGATRIA